MGSIYYYFEVLEYDGLFSVSCLVCKNGDVFFGVFEIDLYDFDY